MELIAIDSDFKERFIFRNGSSDIAVGSEENNFQLDFDLNFFEKMKSVKFISIDKSEFGGKINSYKIDTAENRASLLGTTWRGILTEKIIKPVFGNDYYTVSGQPNLIISHLLEICQLDELFSVRDFENTEIINLQLKRYCTLLEAINDILEYVNCVLNLEYDNGKVYISAFPESNDEIDNYDCDFIIKKSICPINHLICLGKGELKNRQVIDLYLQKSGTIGKVQYYFGADERTAVYDYSNVESLEDLERSGIQHFNELISQEENAELSLYNTDKEIGQSITVYEHITGEKLTKCISKKVFTSSKNNSSIQYEVK